MLKRNSVMIIGASMLAIGSAYAGGDPNATTEETVQNQNSGTAAEQGSTSSGSSASGTSQTSSSASDSSQSGAQSGVASQTSSGGQAGSQSAIAQSSGYEGFDAIEDDELVIDTESLADGDGLGSIQVQWQISNDGSNWGVLPGAIQSSFTPRF